MTASELIEKIHNKEIKSGTKIICHKKNEYFDYKVTRWFMGNWFSKVPPALHTSSSDKDEEMILELCDESVTYTIIDKEETQKKVSELQSEIDLLSNEIGKYHNIIHSMRDRNNYMKEQLKELMRIVANED